MPKNDDTVIMQYSIMNDDPWTDFGRTDIVSAFRFVANPEHFTVGELRTRCEKGELKWRGVDWITGKVLVGRGSSTEFDLPHDTSKYYAEAAARPNGEYLCSIQWYPTKPDADGPSKGLLKTGEEWYAYMSMPGMNQKRRVPNLDARNVHHVGQLVSEVLMDVFHYGENGVLDL